MLRKNHTKFKKMTPAEFLKICDDEGIYGFYVQSRTMKVYYVTRDIVECAEADWVYGYVENGKRRYGRKQLKWFRLANVKRAEWIPPIRG